MDRSEVIDYLHDDVGYSRRMSCKLADIALLVKSEKPFEVALRSAIEKARKPGSKDKRPRKRKYGAVSRIPQSSRDWMTDSEIKGYLDSSGFKGKKRQSMKRNMELERPRSAKERNW